MRLLIICVALGSASAAGTRSPREQWSDFLTRPTGENYQRIAKTVEGCRSSTCETDVAPDSTAVLKLVELVNKGHRRAVALAFLSLRLLDGGNLEDVARSLAGVTESSPHVFLEEIKKRGLSPPEMRAILGKVPESVIDDDTKRRDAVEKRIRSLSTVSDKRLIKVRNQAVTVLRAVLEDIDTSE